MVERPGKDAIPGTMGVGSLLNAEDVEPDVVVDNDAVVSVTELVEAAKLLLAECPTCRRSLS